MKFQRSFTILLTAVLILFLIYSFSGDKKVYVNEQKINIPEEVDFAGEPMPLKHFDVHESLERELVSNSFFHSNTILLIKRSYRYFPLIEKILLQNNIPDDFKYLCVAESSLSNVISPSEAVGFWQFRKGAAIEFGLEVNDDVDERYHIAKSTEAACKYLTVLYKKFKSWTLAAAAYNTGPYQIDQYISRQKEINYYDMYMNPETGRYIYRIVALKLIISNPHNYGFMIDKTDRYIPIPADTIFADTNITDLSNFALQHGSNYKMLKLMNPWLRNNSLYPKNGKSYIIELPQKEFRTFDTHISDSVYLK